MTVSEYRKVARTGAYAWPGGYPKYALTTDGEALCWSCAFGRENRSEILWSLANEVSDGWRVECEAINWEGEAGLCAHCGDRIESAYGDS